MGTASSVINASQFVLAGLFGTILMLRNADSAIPFAVMMAGLVLVSLFWIFFSFVKQRSKLVNTS